MKTFIILKFEKYEYPQTKTVLHDEQEAFQAMVKFQKNMEQDAINFDYPKDYKEDIFFAIECWENGLKVSDKIYKDLKLIRSEDMYSSAAFGFSLLYF